MRNKKNIILFTAAFPYGDGEQFLETEINYLCNAFETVFVFPLHKFDKIRPIPNNCKVVDFAVNFEIKGRVRKYFFTHFRIIFSIIFKTILYSKTRWQYLFKLKKYILDLIFEIEIAKNYLEFLKDYLPKVDVIYFYWFDKPVINFCILKSQGRIDHLLITRTHSYDYENSGSFFHKFREYELSVLNLILPVSNYGVQYFKDNYSTFSNNVKVSYLGTNDYGINPLNYGNTIHIVSCSLFNSRKRLHLIVEILKNFKEDVVWTHFGSGPLEEEISMQAKSLANNVSINFKGLVDNKDIMNFYLNTHVDFFINVSEIEGIPVSLMEAISFGIPVLGCNICGVPEIVNFRTGYLLGKYFNPKDVANIIKDHHSKPVEQKIEFTKSVKSFWFENFNAKKNYIDFIDNKLKNL